MCVCINIFIKKACFMYLDVIQESEILHVAPPRQEQVSRHFSASLPHILRIHLPPNLTLPSNPLPGKHAVYMDSSSVVDSNLAGVFQESYVAYHRFAPIVQHLLEKPQPKIALFVQHTSATVTFASVPLIPLSKIEFECGITCHSTGVQTEQAYVPRVHLPRMPMPKIAVE